MKSDDERRLIVVCKRRQDYVDFCRKHDLNPNDRRLVIWVPGPDELRGYYEEWVIFLDYISQDMATHLAVLGNHDVIPEPRDGRYDFPKVSVRRGGIRYGR